MILSGKEGITLIFFVFFDQMCTTLLICISNNDFLGVFSSTNANKCHIINFLLTSLAQNAQINIGSRSFVQTSSSGLGLYKEDLGLIFLCIQTSRSVNKNLIICMKKLYRSKFMVTSRHETQF